MTVCRLLDLWGNALALSFAVASVVVLAATFDVGELFAIAFVLARMLTSLVRPLAIALTSMRLIRLAFAVAFELAMVLLLWLRCVGIFVAADTFRALDLAIVFAVACAFSLAFVAAVAYALFV